MDGHYVACGGGKEFNATDVACCIKSLSGCVRAKKYISVDCPIVSVISINFTLSSQETASVAERLHLPWLAPSTDRGWIQSE